MAYRKDRRGVLEKKENLKMNEVFVHDASLAYFHKINLQTKESSRGEYKALNIPSFLPFYLRTLANN